MEFHLVGWLHKRLTSVNVAFFPLKKLSLTEKIREPYIISFNHSRPDDPVAFSGRFQDTNPHYHYQHPAYLKSTSRYSPEFDYYSLALVLLEIGLWKPLSLIIPNLHSYSAEKIKREARWIPDTITWTIYGRGLPGGSEGMLGREFL